MVLKDVIKGTCEMAIESSRAVNDGSGNNIADTYQEKIGTGYFTGNIDTISKNNVCICESSNIEGGELPLSNETPYTFILKTEHVDETGNLSSKAQTAILEENGICREFMRTGSEYAGYTSWEEIQTSRNIEDFSMKFTSEDVKEPTGYTDFDTIKSGEKQSSLWQKVSLLAKNLRYLWKLCGTNDISGLADGTLTGAVSKLNTDLQYKDISSEIVITFPGIPCRAYVENGIVFISSAILKTVPYELTELFTVPLKYAPRVTTYTDISVAASRNDMNKVLSVGIRDDGRAYVWLEKTMYDDEPFTIQYPLKRS